MLPTSNNRSVQKHELADKTKLTAVTIGHGRRRIQSFVMLRHDANGAAILPQATLDKLLDQCGVRRGDTYTVS